MNTIWSWFIESLNTRELAIGIWLVFAAGYLLYWQKTRQSLIAVFHAAVQWKLLVMFGSLAVHVSVLCWLLAAIDLWTNAQIAPTILWFFLTGITLLARSLTVKEDDRYFRTLNSDSFKIGIIFEFVVVAYTFSMIVELLLVPALATLGALLAVAETKKEYKPARLLFKGIITVIVLALIWHSLSQAWNDPSALFTTQNGRNFLLPIYLTIGCAPFFYLWYCISNYELANIRIGFKQFQPDELKRYARRQFFIAFFLKPWLLQRATRQFQLLPANSTSDVDAIISEIRTQERESKCPPPVAEQEGWSPYLARYYLTTYGLKSGDYHVEYGNDEWWASSSYADLDDSILPNTATFYLEGRQGVVTTLKLKGHFYKEPDPTDAMKKFRAIAESLVAEALNISPDVVSPLIPNDDSFRVTLDDTQVSSRIDEYPSNKGFEWNFILSRGESKQ